MMKFYAVYKQILDPYTGYLLDERCTMVADTKKEIASMLGVSERVLFDESVKVRGKLYKIYEYYIDKSDVYDV